MKFARYPVAEAAGVILAHAVRGAVTLKKGRVLTADDVTNLTAAGISHVSGVRLAPGDIAEDAAAAAIAARLGGRGVAVSPARTGRCNLVAQCDGVVRISAASVDGANSVDEAVTIATLADLHDVRRGQIIATVKIIPFAVTATTMAQVSAAIGGPAVEIAPYHAKKIALISTRLPGLKDSVARATEEITRQRVAEIGGTILSSVAVDHDPDAVSRALGDALSEGAEIILIVGASATSDRNDVVPLGIVAAGGVVEHFGMPVDPGNLLVLARKDFATILVLPGCARSPKLNGVDWVMRRLAAGLPLGRREIMAMGVGGLLVDTPARPLPRAQAVQAPGRASYVGAIILAAGQSRRMAGKNKLLMEIEGVPLVRRTAAAVRGAGVAPVIVVTGHESAGVEEALDGLDVTVVHNPNYAEGLSTSLKTGLAALPPEATAALICLGDMPEVEKRHIARLVEHFDPDEGRAIGVPTHNGKRGNPVLWSRRFFQEMLELAGDVGARHLIGANESLVYEIEFNDTGVLMDLDTPGQWEDYLSSSSPPRSR